MTQDEYVAQWRCSQCQTEYVVPSLARECEQRHKENPAQLWAAS